MDHLVAVIWLIGGSIACSFSRWIEFYYFKEDYSKSDRLFSSVLNLVLLVVVAIFLW